MARPTRNYVSSSEDEPEFFKVFMPSTSASTMWIPPGFVSNFIRKVPKNATLKDETGGSWSVRVEKIGDRLCFTTGWASFVRANLLEPGELLLFKLVTNSSFEVKIYGTNGCKKNQSPNFGHQKSSSAKKSDSTSEESEDESEIRLVKKNLKRKRAPKPQNSASGLSSEKVKGKELAEFTATKSQRFSITYTAKSCGRYVVHIPHRAAKGIRIEEDMVLRCQNNQLWPVGTRPREDGRYLICSGWVRFVNNYCLKPHDQCLFELVVDGTNTCREIRVDVIRRKCLN